MKPQEPGSRPALLSVRDLSVTIRTDFGRVQAVNRVDFDLLPGR